MSADMDCARVHELLLDRWEDTLGPVLRRELDAHLGTCAGCRELARAYEDLVGLLRVQAPPPPRPGFEERVAAASWRRATAARLALPRPVLALAAAVALAVSGILTLGWGAATGSIPTAQRVVQRATNTGVKLLERKDRLVEDIRLLRVLVTTAFEGRAERVNDRVDDYRRLLERRRAPEPAEAVEKKKTNLERSRLVKTV